MPTILEDWDAASKQLPADVTPAEREYFSRQWLAQRKNALASLMPQDRRFITAHIRGIPNVGDIEQPETAGFAQGIGEQINAQMAQNPLANVARAASRAMGGDGRAITPTESIIPGAGNLVYDQTDLPEPKTFGEALGQVPTQVADVAKNMGNLVMQGPTLYANPGAGAALAARTAATLADPVNLLELAPGVAPVVRGASAVAPVAKQVLGNAIKTTAASAASEGLGGAIDSAAQQYADTGKVSGPQLLRDTLTEAAVGAPIGTAGSLARSYKDLTTARPPAPTPVSIPGIEPTDALTPELRDFYSQAATPELQAFLQRANPQPKPQAQPVTLDEFTNLQATDPAGAAAYEQAIKAGIVPAPVDDTFARLMAPPVAPLAATMPGRAPALPGMASTAGTLSLGAPPSPFGPTPAEQAKQANQQRVQQATADEELSAQLESLRGEIRKAGDDGDLNKLNELSAQLDHLTGAPLPPISPIPNPTPPTPTPGWSAERPNPWGSERAAEAMARADQQIGKTKRDRQAKAREAIAQGGPLGRDDRNYTPGGATTFPGTDATAAVTPPALMGKLGQRTAAADPMPNVPDEQLIKGMDTLDQKQATGARADKARAALGGSLAARGYEKVDGRWRKPDAPATAAAVEMPAVQPTRPTATPATSAEATVPAAPAARFTLRQDGKRWVIDEDGRPVPGKWFGTKEKAEAFAAGANQSAAILPASKPKPENKAAKPTNPPPTGDIIVKSLVTGQETRIPVKDQPTAPKPEADNQPKSFAGLDDDALLAAERDMRAELGKINPNDNGASYRRANKAYEEVTYAMAVRKFTKNANGEWQKPTKAAAPATKAAPPVPSKSDWNAIARGTVVYWRQSDGRIARSTTRSDVPSYDDTFEVKDAPSSAGGVPIGRISTVRRDQVLGQKEGERLYDAQWKAEPAPPARKPDAEKTPAEIDDEIAQLRAAQAARKAERENGRDERQARLEKDREDRKAERAERVARAEQERAELRGSGEGPKFKVGDAVLVPKPGTVGQFVSATVDEMGYDPNTRGFSYTFYGGGKHPELPVGGQFQERHMKAVGEPAAPAAEAAKPDAVKALRDRLHAEADAEAADFFKDFRTNTVGFNPQMAAILVKKGAAIMLDGVVAFTEWADALRAWVRERGGQPAVEAMEPNLDDLFDQAIELRVSELEALKEPTQAGGKMSEAPTTAKEDGDATLRAEAPGTPGVDEPGPRADSPEGRNPDVVPGGRREPGEDGRGRLDREERPLDGGRGRGDVDPQPGPVEPPAAKPAKTPKPAKPADPIASPAGFSSKPGAAQPTSRNFRWPADFEPVRAGEGKKTKFKNNVAAIKLIKQLETEGRLPTADEQLVLAKYVGWGGIPEPFNPWRHNSGAERWNAEYDELRQVLTPAEHKSAMESTDAAHYTSRTVIEGIYDGLVSAGFKGGRILEPGLGTGNFIGLMPPVRATVMGAELDSITGRIAQKLYPDADIHVASYEKVAPEYDLDGFFDLAIGNVPFSDAIKPADLAYNKGAKLNLHNWYFVKSLAKVRPGGVVAFITSTGTLDTDPAVLALLAKDADLVAAVRLPNDAFDRNAGTRVTTDLLVLRKRMPGEKPRDLTWTKVGETDVEGNTVRLNDYYKKNPKMLLGTPAPDQLYQRGARFALKSDGRDLRKAIADALKGALPKDTFARQAHKATDAAPVDVIAPPGTKVKQNALTLHEGKVVRLVRGRLVAPELPAVKDAEAKARVLIGVRDALRDVFHQQHIGAAEAAVKAAQSKLGKFYDAFVAKFGPITDKANVRVMEGDPDRPLLLALEKRSKDGKTVSKTDVFTKATIQPQSQITTADTAADALTIVLSTVGKVDMGQMQALTGLPEQRIVQDLAGVIFEDPKDGWVTADEYLSGNVRAKLREAKIAAKGDEKFAGNVEALEAVQPDDVPFEKIALRLGASWLPPATIQHFVQKLTVGHELNAHGAVAVTYSRAGALWDVSLKDYRAVNSVANTQDFAVTSRKYNGTEKTLEDLLNDMMNFRESTMYYEIGRDAENRAIRAVDNEATEVAKETRNRIQKAFDEWVAGPENDALRGQLMTLYNEQFNAIRSREFDGKHLAFPGMAAGIDLFAHQRNAVWRAVQERRAVFAHAVGAGKTYAMAATAMELRRLGIAKKPMFAVPNHLVEQFPREFQALYPAANILAVTEKDLAKENRQKLMARIATGDWDAVFIPHSQLIKIPNDPAIETAIIQGEMDDLDASIEAMTAELGKEAKGNRVVKQLAKSRKALKARLDTLQAKIAKRADNVVTFSDLGVDFLLVDEAHNFKNLRFATKRSRVAGLGQPNGVEKTFDMLAKVRHAQARQNGRGVIFATGTPVTNSMAEMYHLLKYLMPEEMDRMGIKHFDAWASNFGETITELEPDLSGQGYKSKTRFSRFFNLPELATLFRSVADVQTAEMLKLPVPEAEIINVYATPSENLLAYTKDLLVRANNLKGKALKGGDNMLKLTGLGRTASLSMRLIDDRFPDEPESKINLCIGNVLKEYRDGTGVTLTGPDGKPVTVGTTQMIFLDTRSPEAAAKRLAAEAKAAKARVDENGEALDEEDADAEAEAEQDADTGNSSGAREMDFADGKSSYSPYHDIKEKLIAGGVPADEIAFIHDAKDDKQKAALLAKVREGTIRVLLGSTPKMGEGTNVQQYLGALHHLDATWTPSGMEQRNGRIVRQGNRNAKVRIYTYATKRSFDSNMFQVLAMKQAFIEQILRGDLSVREGADLFSGAMDFGEMSAAASDNPLEKERINLEKRIGMLTALIGAHEAKQKKMRADLSYADRSVQTLTEQLAEVKKDRDQLRANRPEPFSITIAGKTFDAKDEAGQALLDLADKMKPGTEQVGGEYAGFKLRLTKHTEASRQPVRDFDADGKETLRFVERFHVGAVARGAGDHAFNLTDTPTGTVDSLLGSLRRIDKDDLAETQVGRNLAARKKDAADLRVTLAKPSEHATDLKQAQARMAEINGLRQKMANEAAQPKVEPQAGSGPDAPTDWADTLEATGDRLIAEADELMRRRGYGFNANGLDYQGVKAGGLYGAGLVLKGVVHFGRWLEAMTAKFGTLSEDNLRSILYHQEKALAKSPEIEAAYAKGMYHLLTYEVPDAIENTLGVGEFRRRAEHAPAWSLLEDRNDFARRISGERRTVKVDRDLTLPDVTQNAYQATPNDLAILDWMDQILMLRLVADSNNGARNSSYNPTEVEQTEALREAIALTKTSADYDARRIARKYDKKKTLREMSPDRYGFDPIDSVFTAVENLWRRVAKSASDVAFERATDRDPDLLQARIAKGKAQLAAPRVDELVARIERQVAEGKQRQVNPRAVETQGTAGQIAKRDGLAAKMNQAAAALEDSGRRQLAAELRDLTLGSTPIKPGAIHALAKLLAARLLRAGANLTEAAARAVRAEFSREMIKEHGDGFKGIARKVAERADAYVDATRQVLGNIDLTSEPGQDENIRGYFDLSPEESAAYTREGGSTTAPTQAVDMKSLRSVGFGKAVGGDFYAHKDGLKALPKDAREAVASLAREAGVKAADFDLVKFSKDGRPSLLSYPTFHSDAFPALARSWTRNAEGGVTARDYREHANRPILHRKELFLPPDHPRRAEHAAMTRAAEEAALFDGTPPGFERQWQDVLDAKGVRVEGNSIVVERRVPAAKHLVSGHAEEKNNVAATSIRQIPALHKRVAGDLGPRNLDLGGGKYDLATDFLRDEGVENMVLDPYSRPADHNARVLAAVERAPADSATVANVLNVIEEAGIRRAVLDDAKRLTKPGARVFFDIYEGNGKGIGAKTSTGSWQNNRKAQSYLDEVQEVFPDAERRGTMIVATNPGPSQNAGPSSLGTTTTGGAGSMGMLVRLVAEEGGFFDAAALFEAVFGRRAPAAPKTPPRVAPPASPLTLYGEDAAKPDVQRLLRQADHLQAKLVESDQRGVPLAKRVALAVKLSEVRAQLEAIHTDVSATRAKAKDVANVIADPASPPAYNGAKMVGPKGINFWRLDIDPDAKDFFAGVLAETGPQFDFVAGTKREGFGEVHAQAMDALATGRWDVQKLLRHDTTKPLNAAQITASRILMATVAGQVSELAKAKRDDTARLTAAERDARDATLVRGVELLAAMSAQTEGATKAIARALSAHRIMASSQVPAERQIKAILENGVDGIGALAERIAEIEDAEAIIIAARTEVLKDTWAHKAMEWWVMALLSAPITHARNIFGNALNVFGTLGEETVAAGISAARSKLDGEPVDVGFDEVTAQWAALFASFGDAVNIARLSWKENTPMSGVSQMDAHEGAIKGRLGEIVRTPGRALMAEDEFFKVLAYRMSLAQQAAAEARKQGEAKSLSLADQKALATRLTFDPTETMVDRARTEAHYRTFQQQMGEIGKMLLRAKSKHPMATVVIPFVKTPVNIVKYAGERSPLAPFAQPVRDELQAGGARRDRAIAKMALGTTFMSVAAAFAAAGMITGTGPEDPEDRATLMATGWRPYAFKVAGAYLPFNQVLGPYGMLMGSMGDLAERWALNNTDQDKKGAGLAAQLLDTVAMGGLIAARGNVLEQTFLRGLHDFSNMVYAPKQFAQRWASNIVAGFVPNILGKAADAADPYLRDQAGNGFVDEMGRRVQAKIPGASRYLPAREDLLGNPIERNAYTRQVGLTGLPFPAYPGVETSDKLLKEMVRLGENISKAPRKLEVKGQDIPLTTDQRRELGRLKGQAFAELARPYVEAPEWGTSSEDEQRAVLEKLRGKASTAAREQYIDAHYDEVLAAFAAATGSGTASMPDAPPAAQATMREMVQPVKPGNIDLDNRPVVKNGDGSISTVRSISIGTDEGVYLIPTVVRGKVVSNEAAVRYFRQTGEHLGLFTSEADAKVYADHLHEDQARQYAPRAGR
jgi:N12 class adenine-specific DNA methylase